MSKSSESLNNRGALWDARKGEEGDLAGWLNIDGIEHRVVARFNPKYDKFAEPKDPKIPAILLYHIYTRREVADG